MILLWLLPVLLSSLVMAAHFLRSGDLVPMLLVLALPTLLLIRRPWTPRIVQLVLLVGAFVWLQVALQFIAERQAEGVSWTALAIILGSVALFTAASGLVFFSPALKSHYRAAIRSASLL